jgi:hypothetical protein
VTRPDMLLSSADWALRGGTCALVLLIDDHLQ